ncbi:serine/threonine protein kinase [Candidatus Gracilibacteria bacterium]|nr:serine/threonine protein kinase [Candidatus Gracilibacteria bacterium]
MENNRYTISGQGEFELAGEGGMARVYRGIDDPSMAIKIPDLDPYKGRDREILAERFRFECIAAQTLGTRTPHNNYFPRTRGVLRNVVMSNNNERGTKHHDAALMMEWVTGGTLRDRLQKDVPMNAGEITELGAQISYATHLAHSVGIVNRDIKPDNILLGESGPKMTDFGICGIIGWNVRERAHPVMGTPQYLSPQAKKGNNALDFRGDIYALGATLYQCVTGKKIDANPTAAEKKLTEQKTDPRLARCITTMFHPDPEKRYLTALNAATDLAKLAVDQTPTLRFIEPYCTLLGEGPDEEQSLRAGV